MISSSQITKVPTWFILSNFTYTVQKMAFFITGSALLITDVLFLWMLRYCLLFPASLVIIQSTCGVNKSLGLWV